MLRKDFTGFAAIEKETGKGLACSYGITNRLSLTDDPDKVLVLPQPELVETHIAWFNNTHKNQKEFKIKKVTKMVYIREED